MPSRRAQTIARVLLGSMLLLSIGAYFALRLDRYVTVEGFKAHLGPVLAWRDADPLMFGLLYFLVFVLSAAISFPGAVALSMPAGALFGLFWGTLIVSFATSIGAWLAFLSARYVLRAPVERMLGHRLPALNASIERDGTYYLCWLRMVPVLPYFMINLMMGLTQMSGARFYWVSQASMFAGSVLMVYAGEQLAHINTFMDLLTPGMCTVAVLLMLFPWASRRLLGRWRRPVAAP